VNRFYYQSEYQFWFHENNMADIRNYFDCNINFLKNRNGKIPIDQIKGWISVFLEEKYFIELKNGKNRDLLSKSESEYTKLRTMFTKMEF
jgi:hypothetical protein